MKNKDITDEIEKMKNLSFCYWYIRINAENDNIVQRIVDLARTDLGTRIQSFLYGLDPNLRAQLDKMRKDNYIDQLLKGEPLPPDATAPEERLSFSERIRRLRRK